jgi:hypothetical protein
MPSFPPGAEGHRKHSSRRIGQSRRSITDAQIEYASAMRAAGVVPFSIEHVGTVLTDPSHVNNLDILAVERAVSYLGRVSFESKPILPTGSGVLSGVSAQVPLLIDIDPLEERYEPNNRTMTLADSWVGILGGGDDDDGDGHERGHFRRSIRT